MRIGIVNDMALAAESMRRVVLLGGHQVAWIAVNGVEAVAMCARDTPDLVLMDLYMPKMDGVEATRRIMAETPCPILVVTINVGASAWQAYDAMACGALDAVDTPTLANGDLSKAAEPLLRKIENIGRRFGKKPQHPVAETRHAASHAHAAGATTGLVAIGSSAGGPAALSEVLSRLPADFNAAVVIVQHIDEQFVDGMADWLGKHSALPVRVARQSDPLRAGEVLLSRASGHLVMRDNELLGYSQTPLNSIYQPSIDVFFKSVCKCWQGKAVGVQLSGMGADGAEGLKLMRDKGHYTIAQDQETCAVYGMPKAAAALGAAVDILPVQQIASKLVALFGRK